ncbi:MAG TPA: hypothetical protein VN317_11050, partial [Candidatus Methanoperedens sp.]|nr:hypothetical protein [Candidatus Methanoperedens sp.]
EPLRGAGGTPGGMGLFFAGLAMAAIGGYLLLNQVMVSGGFWDFLGFNAFGLSLLPLLIGVGFLFFDGRSVTGWALSVIGAGIIVAGILMNLHIWFRPTSLYNTLVMLVLLAGGLGLIARSLKAAGGRDANPPAG